MTTKLTTAAAILLAFGMAVTSTAEAGGRGGNGGHRSGNFNSGFRSSNFGQGHFGQRNFVQKNFGHNFQKAHHPSFGNNFHHHRNDNFFRTVSIHRPHFQFQPRFANYHLTYGRKFDFGYCYFGQNHSHWASTSFYEPFGCNIYFCPCTQVWYYWCAPHGCYYPVSYCPTGSYIN